MGLLATYLGIKIAAYCLWCWLGLRVLGSPWHAGPKTVLLMGATRLAIGLIMGWSLAFFLTWLAPERNRIGFSLWVFYPSLVILRWFEWSLLSSVIRKTLGGFLFGRAARDNFWRLGGVAVSSATDASVVLVIGAFGWVPC